MQQQITLKSIIKRMLDWYRLSHVKQDDLQISIQLKKIQALAKVADKKAFFGEFDAESLGDLFFECIGYMYASDCCAIAELIEPVHFDASFSDMAAQAKLRDFFVITIAQKVAKSFIDNDINKLAETCDEKNKMFCTNANFYSTFEHYSKKGILCTFDMIDKLHYIVYSTEHQIVDGIKYASGEMLPAINTGN